jgi:hypothetical protein
MYGIVEVISLLVGLQGFGLQANPHAPTPDQILAYAIADADLVAHVDVASIVPNNYKLLTKLAEQPQIKASPELAKLVRQAVAEIEGPRGLALQASGIDITTDIADITAFVKFVPHADPSLVVEVHGKFTGGTIKRIALVAHQSSTTINGGEMVDIDHKAVAVTKDGVLLAGTSDLVLERLQPSWKAPARSGTNLANVADALAGKPVFAVVLAMSQAARADALANQKPNFATELVSRHKLAAFAIYHDGIGWTWIDSTKSGLEAMTTFSEGAIDLLRAAQIAPRGFAKMLVGALDAYRSDPRVAEVIKHRAEIMKVVDAYTGDGKFAAKIDADPKALRLAVRATGKSLSDVLPLGVAAPFVAFAVLVTMPSPLQPFKIDPAPVPPPRRK